MVGENGTGCIGIQENGASVNQRKKVLTGCRSFENKGTFRIFQQISLLHRLLILNGHDGPGWVQYSTDVTTRAGRSTK